MKFDEQSMFNLRATCPPITSYVKQDGLSVPYPIVGRSTCTNTNFGIN